LHKAEDIEPNEIYAPPNRIAPKYPQNIVPLSGFPSQFTVGIIGKVRSIDIIIIAHAARNFPNTASNMLMGIVSRSSIVPAFCSSAHILIDIGGVRIRNNHGKKGKKLYERDA